MPTLSVAMIVKNEAHHLAQCLDTVKAWVDEIVILDSGSTDTTQQIAEQYGAKFYQNTDWPGFGKQRQLAQQYVTSDYVLWLDADERVTPELRQSIQAAIAQDAPNTAYKIPRLSEIFGHKIRHSGWYPDYVIRLYRKDFAHYGDQLVHEKVELPANANIQNYKGICCIIHTKISTITWLNLLAMPKRGQTNEKKPVKKATLWQGISHAVGCFVKMYVIRLGFLDGKAGLLLAILSAHSTFVKYADLWVRTQKSDS